MEKVLQLIFCHFLGDYFLQSDYLATRKGKDWYAMIAHCVLYCVPFYVVFGMNPALAYVFIMHVAIDTAKARYHLIGLVTDQLCHFVTLVIYIK